MSFTRGFSFQRSRGWRSSARSHPSFGRSPAIVADARIPAATVTKSMEEAVRRYTEAASHEATRAEAFLRRGRIELALGQADQRAGSRSIE